MNLKQIHHKDVNANQAPTLEAAYKELAVQTSEALLLAYHSSMDGLEEKDAAKRLEQDGPNKTSSEKGKSWTYFLLHSFLDAFILVLLALAVISFVMEDPLGGAIILILACLSALLRFYQDYSAYRSSERLRTMIHTTVEVRREKKLVKLNIESLVKGDVVELGAGSIIPADCIVLQSKDLYISQSMFTGESAPVEKKSGALPKESLESKESVQLENFLFMGSNVVSGSATALVVLTGKDTYLGHISQSVEHTKGKTNFENGLDAITRVLLRYMIVVCISVFFINGLIRRDWLNAFMFAVAVAVGITPGMLPMIVNATLSKGAQFLAKKKTIVKNISSIQNIGAMDTLCTDKTGTLTINNVELQRYMNIQGQDDRSILDTVYLNSYFGTGIKNLIDEAILSYGDLHGVKEDVQQYKKIDEIPFDYDRKRSSVVIADGENRHRLITKGAIEEILKICTRLKDGEKIIDINPEISSRIMEHGDQLNNDGMHVIAVCEKQEQIDIETFKTEDEQGMTFVGYIAFLDPPKPDVAQAIRDLTEAGVEIKVLTGDAPLVAKHICYEVGMKQEDVLTGSQIQQMTDAELLEATHHTNIFARLAPMQKQRVVVALRQAGHVVGYMGDGVNDAPALRAADVGISVDTATDIAKESSDIILLEQSLHVLREGVYEGRRIYGNIMKYMKMALSSNFGNVFSVLVASLFLPFLPMLPIQMLIQNMVYDFTQIAIPWDQVDPEFLVQPKKWDTKSLSRFMNAMGVTSSIFDVITFAALWFVIGYNTVAMQENFQTGWFIEGLFSQTLIVHFIRTSKIPFIQSRADWRLMLSTLTGMILAIVLPVFLASIKSFNFALLSPEYYIFLFFIILSYAASIQLVKKFYIRRYGEWL